MSNFYDYLERLYKAGYNAFLTNGSEVCRDKNFLAKREYLRGYNQAYHDNKLKKFGNVTKKPYSFSTTLRPIQKANS